MPDDKALVPVESLGGELISADQDLLAELSTGSGFLPYLQLFTLKSDAVADGKIPGGRYGLVREGEIIDLGKELDVVIFTARARAFQKDAGGDVTIIYDKKDPEYARIASLQADKVKDCMAGPEIFLWVPREKTFATLFCGSPTLKRAARKFKPFIGGKACHLRVELIDNGKYKWHGPIIIPCSTPPAILPTKEEAEEQVQKFKNPPKPKNAGESVKEGEQEEVER